MEKNLLVWDTLEGEDLIVLANGARSINELNVVKLVLLTFKENAEWGLLCG